MATAIEAMLWCSHPENMPAHYSQNGVFVFLRTIYARPTLCFRAAWLTTLFKRGVMFSDSRKTGRLGLRFEFLRNRLCGTWVASKYGFFSIVLKDGHHHIRSRVEADLQELIAIHPWASEFSNEEWPSADYRYRLRIPQGDPAFGEFMEILFSSVDYSNFKSHIAANPAQRHKLDAYHRIWSILAGLQK